MKKIFKKTVIIINFKTYPEVCGEKAVAAAKLCEKVSQKTKVKIIIGVQTADIYRVALKTRIPVFGQHFDPITPGRFTGWTSALAIKKAGAQGVFLNHSEHSYSDFSALKKAVAIARNEGLKVLIFAPSLAKAKKIDKLNPDYLALEEPSLVSKTAMVKEPKFLKVIRQFSHEIKSFPVLGAGIRTREDIEKSRKLGIKGIAFASEFVRTDNQYKLLLDFASCFSNESCYSKS